MINADLFPASAQFPILTDIVCDATVDITDNTLGMDADFTNAYWLGWIYYDDLPSAYHVSRWYVTDGRLVLDDITAQENVDIGYGYCATVTGSTYPAVIKHDGTNWTVWDRQWTTVVTQSNALRLLNRFDINQTAVTDIICIFAFDIKLNGVSQSYTMGFLVVPVDDFLNGTFSGTCSTAGGNLTHFAVRSGGSVPSAIPISQDNVTGITSTTVDGYDVDIICCGIETVVAPWVDTAGASQAGMTYGVKPMVRLQASDRDVSLVLCSYNHADGFGYQYFCGQGLAYNPSAGVVWAWEQNSIAQPKPDISGDNADLIAGAFTGGFDIDTVRAYCTAGNYGMYYDGSSSFVVHATGNSARAIIRRIGDYDDYRRMVSLYPRLSVSNTYDNGANKFYAAVDAATNQFLCDVVTGNDITRLTVWQVIGQAIGADTAPYDNADKPPYTPGGDGTDNTNTGSDILLPTSLGVGGTNGFITQYALSAAQMQKIGELLWLTFTDPDYYKNFLFTLATTGTINLSNLLDYFVSLRVYPFPLINIPSYDAAGQDMYIGAGIVPLHFDSPLHTINAYADMIDAGSVYVPRYYGDFRDYDNTSIMLFLPYCGTVQLNPTDVIGGTLAARYAVDFATGGVTAYVTVTTSDGRTYPIATMAGSIGADIPLTATNATQIAARLAGDALHVAGMFGNAVETQMQRETGIAVNAVSGNMAGALTGAVDVATAPLHTAGDVVSNALDAVSAPGTKMPMLSGGRGFGAFGQPQTAYIQIRRNLYAQGQAAPAAYRHTYGNAVSKPVTVGSCSGFTMFDNVDTTGLNCTATERDQITALLQSGVYV